MKLMELKKLKTPIRIFRQSDYLMFRHPNSDNLKISMSENLSKVAIFKTHKRPPIREAVAITLILRIRIKIKDSLWLQQQ